MSVTAVGVVGSVSYDCEQGDLNCVHLKWGIPGWRRFMGFFFYRRNAWKWTPPPSPLPPPHPFKISLITKLSGSIIHYVQQHYTINIQKPLLIGRTIVVSSKKKEEEKRTRENSKCIPSRVLVFSFFFYTKMSSVKFLCRIFSLRRKPEQSRSPSDVSV